MAVILALGVVALIAGVAIPIQVRWRRRVREATTGGWRVRCDPGVTEPEGTRETIEVWCSIHPELAGGGTVHYVAAPFQVHGILRAGIADPRMHYAKMLPRLDLLRHELTEISTPGGHDSAAWRADLARLEGAVRERVSRPGAPAS